jgi:AAA domain, putative AbiEii toxin, Type IV TA system
VLMAISLVALAPIIMQSGFTPYYLVRRKGQEIDKPEEAEISGDFDLDLQDLPKKENKLPRIENVLVKIHRFKDIEAIKSPYDLMVSTMTRGRASKDESHVFENMSDDKSSSFMVVGYGASRLIEESGNIDIAARRQKRRLRYERVASMIEKYITLVPLASWLPSFRKEDRYRHKQVIDLINRLLPEDASFAGDFEEGEYWFEINGTKAPFGALSDGYRAYIGWIADLLYHICMGAPKRAKLVETRGIVLVDEIDLHLHPEWQRSVIKTISETLPNLQFVFTSHSPIVAGSLQKENIFVMETTADGASVVKQYDEEIYGLNAEQVLLSPYFNLHTTRATSFAGELKQLSLKAGRGDLDAALAFMERLASPNTHNGKSSVKAVTASKKATSKKKPSSKK